MCAYCEKMTLKITDLPVDVLSQILSSVAKLSDGATDVAKCMTVCKRFLAAGNSHVVFKVVCFRRVEVASRYHLFRQIEGLLYKCASFGNSFAQFLLAQVILKCSAQLKRFGIKPSTLKNFQEYSPRCNTGRTKFQEEYLSASLLSKVVPGKGPRPFSYHWELVKLFLSNCNRMDIYNMHRNLQEYVEYFSGSRIGRGTDADVLLLYCMFDPETEYSWLMKHYPTLLNGGTLSTISENVVGEPMRMKVLEAFDRVYCNFPSFVEE